MHLCRGPPKSTRDDPNFVQSFYKSSRLHFIGALLWPAVLLLPWSSCRAQPRARCLFVYGMQDVLSRWAVWESLFVNAGPTCAGTWKARIETLMESDAARRGPQPAPHLPGRPRVVMHIDMVSSVRLVFNTTVGVGTGLLP